MQKGLKFKIISEGLQNGVTITCEKYNISRTIYYRWLNRYKASGMVGLEDVKKNFSHPNKTATEIETALLKLIKDYPTYGPRALKYLFDELGHNLSESAVYNIMKRNNLSTKEQRIKFARKCVSQIASSIPPLSKLHSGECWVFWVTYYGIYETTGPIYEYTLFDLRSRISCTRLYNDVSFTNFEDLLAAVAMPVANTLNLKINYLCFFPDSKLMKHAKKSFIPKLNQIIANNGFGFKAHLLLTGSTELRTISTLRQKYTEGCLSFLLPLLQEDVTFVQVKTKFQQYLRDYNLSIPSIQDGEAYSPIAYHNKLSQTKLILPIWAYIDRTY